MERPPELAPSLAALDPRRLRPLRSEQHAALKNELMMSVLSRLDWFREYRARLEGYRARPGDAAPAYPSEAVERVEALVDQLIRDAVDPSYAR